ncbi:hypothetical protein C8Q79DRAFT_102638 [Trametes meyenii]|nr:hypothetical protein C8Q79DRAFT_102638 [Trametes meyenii]
MRRTSESPGGGARKRRRLSSPMYEDHFGPISQQEAQALDEIETSLSQSVPVVPSQSRGLPPEKHDQQGSVGLDDNDLLGGEDVIQRDGSTENPQEWSSSPFTNNPSSQDRVADDNFFASTTPGGFASAATMDTTAKASCVPYRVSGCTSASALSAKLPPAPSFGGFSSAAKLPQTSQTRSQDSDPSPAVPFVPPTFSGFGLASALPMQLEDDRPTSPSSPPRQDYDSWFDSDASALPQEAFAFKTARTVLATTETEDPGYPGSSQTAQFGGFTSGLSQWKSASQTDPRAATDVIMESTSASNVGFAPASQIVQAGFSSAAQLHGAKTNWAAPSAEALARAAKKMKQWEAEIDREEGEKASSDIQNMENAAPPNSKPPVLHPSVNSQTPLRPALRPMENASSSTQTPGTPSPASVVQKKPPHFTVVAGMQIKNTPFKSPLITRPQGQPRSISAPSPLNAARGAGFRVASGSKLPPAFSNASSLAGPSTPAKHAPGTSAFVSPLKPTATMFASPSKPDASSFASQVHAGTPSFASPVKALGMTPRRMGVSNTLGKGKFSTPFKPGMAPGEPGRSQLGERLKEEQVKAAGLQPLQVYVSGTPSRKGKERKTFEFFNLNPPSERKRLVSSGLRPMSYEEEELIDMDINVEELRQMQPSNAVYYRFHSAASTIGVEDPAESQQLGPEDAYTQLKERGCRLATQAWVTNHYGLILWKLAGMVCLEPEREQGRKTKRWCWSEVIRQLLYRYERELNGGSRPALRLISTEDAPAACPMVLCVSSIVICGPPKEDEAGLSYDPHPQLEVTDGWYRLRANIDLPLARAVRRGLIRVGTKLAVAGAKLSGTRKEACEILDAYDNTFIELCGNATNLAPWHAKLGFVKQPFIATLDKLTPDGGIVPVMDLIITKTYPIAFLEFVKNENGSTSRIGPRDEKEENKAHDQWLAKRELESVRIKEKLHAHIQTILRLAERLYGHAGYRFEELVKEDDPLPDDIGEIFDDIMEYRRPSQAWDTVNFMTAGYLERYCRQQADLLTARIGEDVARELEETCPTRNVRDFRVVVAKDARWRKKEPMRTVQVTLWDPLKTIFSENGNPGEIKEGQRFMVTNLMPNQAGAWMPPGPDAVVYLVAKRNARWTNIKSGVRWS